MRYVRLTRTALLLMLVISLVTSAMILLDPGVASAVDTGTGAQAAVKPLLAGLHPATLAAFQLLASLTALVAQDD